MFFGGKVRKRECKSETEIVCAEFCCNSRVHHSILCVFSAYHQFCFLSGILFSCTTTRITWLTATMPIQSIPHYFFHDVLPCTQNTYRNALILFASPFCMCTLRGPSTSYQCSYFYFRNCQESFTFTLVHSEKNTNKNMIVCNLARWTVMAGETRERRKNTFFFAFAPKHVIRVSQHVLPQWIHLLIVTFFSCACVHMCVCTKTCISRVTTK